MCRPRKIHRPVDECAVGSASGPESDVGDPVPSAEPSLTWMNHARTIRPGAVNAAQFKTLQHEAGLVAGPGAAINYDRGSGGASTKGAERLIAREWRWGQLVLSSPPALAFSLATPSGHARILNVSRAGPARCSRIH